MYIEKGKKRPNDSTISNNSEGVKKKEAFAGDQEGVDQVIKMTSKRDDVKEVKTEWFQKEGCLPQNQVLWLEIK